MSRFGCFVLLPTIFACSNPLHAQETKKPARPNIIFIMADDLGYGELGSYGQKKIRTPRLDRMAKEGMRFTQMYSGSPVCAPSRCCLMTGKHGGHAAVRDNKAVKPEGQHPLPRAETTLAEMLKLLGYVTAAIGKWGLGPPGSTGDPLDRGFDSFFGYNCQAHAHNHYPKFLYRNRERLELEGNPGGPTGKHYSHDYFEVEALKFIKSNRDRPFFLYLPVTIPHLALQVPEDSLKEYQGQWEDPPYKGGKGYQPHPTPRAAYAAMVTRLDRTVGKILDLLEELKIDDNTLVVFTSDNGPTHDGAGGSDSIFFVSAGRLRGLKGSVYEGGLRVPFIARWPGRIRGGSTSDLPCYFPDIMPTLLDVAGAKDKTPRGLDGLSMAPTLFGQGEKQPKHDFLYWEFAGYGGQQAVRQGDWKAVRRNLHKGKIDTELYNLREDEGEQTNVAARHPEVVRRLEEILRREHTPNTVFPIKVLDQ
jgi:arylsulfatase